MSRHGLLAVLTFAVIGMAGAGALAALVPEEAAIPLGSLPQGGSAHEIAGRQVVLVREGDRVRGFLRLSPRGRGMVIWCPEHDVFMVPSYGETFDSKGRLIREMSPRDLDAVQVTRRGDRVVVAPDRVTKGRSRIVGQRLVHDWEAIREWRTFHPRRGLPIDFCSAGSG